MDTAAKVKSFHYYLDYLRAHKKLKDLGVVGRDRKMISWQEAERGGQKSYDAVSGRLLRSAISFYFPDWEIKKIRGVCGYQIGVYNRYGYNRRNQEVWNPRTRRYERTNPTPVENETQQAKYWSIISELDTTRANADNYGRRTHSFLQSAHRASFNDLKTTMAAEPNKISFAWDNYNGAFTVSLNATNCGLYSLIEKLPEIKAIIDNCCEIADNKENWLEEQAQLKARKRAAFTKYTEEGTWEPPVTTAPKVIYDNVPKTYAFDPDQNIVTFRMTETYNMGTVDFDRVPLMNIALE